MSPLGSTPEIGQQLTLSTVLKNQFNKIQCGIRYVRCSFTFQIDQLLITCPTPN